MPNRPHPSYSSLRLFQTCPLAFKLSYIEGVPQVPTPAVITGLECHEGVERYARHCWSRNRASDLTEARSIASSYGKEAAEILADWFEEWRWDWGSVVGDGKTCPVEWELSALLPDGETAFTGHVDLIQRYEGAADPMGRLDPDVEPFGDYDARGDDLYVITDFKSGRVRPGDWSQHETYAWLYQRSTLDAEGQPTALDFELRSSMMRHWVPDPTPKYIGGDLSWVGDRLQAQVNRIRDEREFRARPGVGCDTCMVFHACEVGKRVRQDALDGRTPADLGAAVPLLTRAREEWLAELKHQDEDLGTPVAAGDGNEWRWNDEDERNDAYECRDYAALLELVRETGDLLAGRTKSPLERMFGSIGTDAAKKLLGSEEWAEKAAQIIRVRKTGRSFGMYPKRVKPANGEAEPAAAPDSPRDEA